MRALIIEKCYEWSKKPYQKYFKKSKPWDLAVQDLLSHEESTLGFHLGCFLLKYNFEIQPKLEDHDVIHVLTNTGISVQEEIGMQYFLLGNGKKSAYLFMVILSGTLFYPFHLGEFLKYYKRGKAAYEFHDLNFLRMLDQPIKTIRQSFNIK